MLQLTNVQIAFQKTGNYPNDPNVLIQTQVEVVKMPPNTLFCSECLKRDPVMVKDGYYSDEITYFTQCCVTGTISKIQLLEQLDRLRSILRQLAGFDEKD